MRFQICTYLTINELIFHWAQCWSVSARRSRVDHCEIWSFVKGGFLPSSCISQFVIMEIIYKHCKLRIEHILAIHLGKISDLKWSRVNCWQYMSLNVANDLMMIIIDIRQAIDMTLNDAYQLQPWISVSVQNAYTLNRTSIHIISRKKSLKKPSVARLGIFQEKWDISIVADTLAPRIARSSVLTK